MSHADLAVLRTELTDRLSGLDRRVRWLAVARGLGVLAVAVTAAIAAGLLVDLLWDAARPLRMALLGTTGFVALVAAWRGLLRSMLRQSDSAAVAALVESAHPELQERLTSAIELS